MQPRRGRLRPLRHDDRLGCQAFEQAHSLDAGDCADRSLTVIIPYTAASRTISVFVDACNQSHETKESNNGLTKQVEVLLP